MSAATVDRAGQAEAENAFAGQGSVLLDIGGDVGALVVVAPASMEGVEVEIHPLDGSEPRPHDHGHHHHDHPDHGEEHHHPPHVAVVNRPVLGGHVPSLVFGEVREGRYGLALKGSPEIRLRVAVRGGEVTTAEWPD